MTDSRILIDSIKNALDESGFEHTIKVDFNNWITLPSTISLFINEIYIGIIKLCEYRVLITSTKHDIHLSMDLRDPESINQICKLITQISNKEGL